MRRRVRCPGCRATLSVSEAAEERGRMRCPECETVVDVPADRRDDCDDRPSRRKKSSGQLVLWTLLGGALVLLLMCGGGTYMLVRFLDSGSRESPVPLMEARAGYSTKITNPQKIGTGPALAPPADKLQIVRYPASVGQLVAYITPDRRDGKKRPAVVWAHSSHGGIGMEEWDDDSPPMIFAKAGFVVFCPSWRGENDNPGQHEQFFGEVDDAVAAIKYVAGLPQVDPSRIYMVGESDGGTMTLLTVEATSTLRAAFTLGGDPDFGKSLGPLGAFDDGDTPFNPRDKKEKRLRSAIDYIHHVRTPTFYFDVEFGDSLDDAHLMEQRARKAGAPVHVLEIRDQDHEINKPISKLIAAKIKADTGPSVNITITTAEAQKAYDAGP